MAIIKKNKTDDKVWKDSIVEELHLFREDYAKKFNFDLDAMFQDLKLYEKLLKERSSKSKPSSSKKKRV